MNATIKYNSSFIPGLDHTLWNYLKEVTKNFKCTTTIVNIINAYTNLSYQPLYFKKSTFIIISKLNKLAYDNLKAFQPIIILNMLGKLI